MAMPPPKRIEMGHFTRFLGRLHYPQSWGTRPSPVAYLGAADNVLRLLLSPLSDVDQPVIRSRNPFSGPHPARLASL